MTTDVIKLSSLAPGQDLDAYLQTISGFPILGAEEEKALAERFFYDGDIDAARSLVVGHLRFVVHLARSYRGYGMNESDLVQEGNVGLMKAVKRFDPNVGVRLISFAVHWIKAEIHEYVLKNWKIVKIATTKAQRKLFFNLRLSFLASSFLSSVLYSFNFSTVKFKRPTESNNCCTLYFESCNSISFTSLSAESLSTSDFIKVRSLTSNSFSCSKKLMRLLDWA